MGNILITASSRLDAINAVLGVPPDDTRPALDAALGNITLQCAMIQATAAELARR